MKKIRLYSREKYLSKIRAFYDLDMIKMICGIRGSGKSSIMRLIASELKDRGIDDEHIIDISLDKIGLKWVRKKEQLEKIINEIYRDDQFYYLLIDDVQRVKAFEEVILDIHEKGNISIFLAGTDLLNQSVVEKLMGRYVNFEIMTLDFKEYEEMKRFYRKKLSKDINEEFHEYVVNGGFPQTIRLRDMEAKKAYIKSLLEEIYKKDIKARFKIMNKDVFEVVFCYIMHHYGETLTMTRVYNDLRYDENIIIARGTLKSYINILLKAKIIYCCHSVNQETKKTQRSYTKYYVADTGLLLAFNIQSINAKTLDNLVLHYLISHDYYVTVGKLKKLEYRFVTRNEHEECAYIQVAPSITNTDVEEEIYAPFSYLNDKYPKYVLTLDESRKQRDGIKHYHIIDLLLEKKSLK